MSCINLQPSASSSDKVSPYEQFSGMKLDAKRDLRVAFGDYVLATPATTDNSMLPRAEPFIALGEKLNHTGSVWMLSLKTGKVVTRDQFLSSRCPRSSLLSSTSTLPARVMYAVRILPSSSLIFSKRN